MSPRSNRTFATGRLCARLFCFPATGRLGAERSGAPSGATFAILLALASSAAIADDDRRESEHRDDDAKPHVTADDYFPMSLGDRWVYRKTTTHPGEEPAISETYSLVRGEYIFNGELWAHFEEDGICFWLHNRDNGQYEADVGYDEETAGLQIEREFLLFRAPVKKGESWPFLADFLSDEQPGEVRCLATGEKVTTPAGNFACIVYELDEKETKAVYRIARGMGMVASEWTFKETGETIKLELKRFLPGNLRRSGGSGSTASR